MATRRSARIVADLIASCATGVIHGAAGTGKTYAAEAALECLNGAAVTNLHAGIPGPAHDAAGGRRADLIWSAAEEDAVGDVCEAGAGGGVRRRRAGSPRLWCTPGFV